jgi:glycosyltransferase involved in cell wall biosynthesis
MCLSNPKVSVIIPTFNCGQYVTEAIESVLTQTYKDIEIIVVDDGSTDNTKETLKPYIEHGLIQYFYQTNQGPGAARNTGIRAARGEYIAFLDADDLLSSESLSLRKELLDDNEDIILVFTDYFLSGDNFSTTKPRLGSLGFVNRFQDAIETKIGKRFVFNEQFIKLFWEFSPRPICTITVMVRRSLIDKVGYFRTDVSIGEDIDYWMRIAARYKVGYIDEPLAIYNHHASSLTKNTERYYNEAIKMYSRYLNSEMFDRKIVYKKVSSLYFSLGYHYIWNNNQDKARKALMRSIRYNLKNFASVKCLVMSFVPLRLLSFLKTSFREKTYRIPMQEL